MAGRVFDRTQLQQLRTYLSNELLESHSIEGVHIHRSDIEAKAPEWGMTPDEAAEMFERTHNVVWLGYFYPPEERRWERAWLTLVL